jgi:hypothetical protein
MMEDMFRYFSWKSNNKGLHSEKADNTQNTKV